MATDACLTADLGVASWIPAQSHTFEEIDRDIISMVILLPIAESSWNNFYGHSPPFRWIIQEGLMSDTIESMCIKYWLITCLCLPRKRVVRWTDRPIMTIAVDLGPKATKQTNKTIFVHAFVILAIKLTPLCIINCFRFINIDSGSTLSSK